jgi:hypothetical protein
MTQDEQDAALKTIAQYDEMFDRATGWGSWMVEAANDRERLVNKLNANGHEIEHKNLARTADEGRVS